MNIIELAKQAGLGTSLTHNGGEPRIWIEGADWHEELTRFAALVRAQALEEAAGAIEQTRHPWGGSPKEHYIATIRALKEKPND